MKKQLVLSLGLLSAVSASVSGAVFPTPSAMHTLSRNFVGRALVSESWQEFQNYMLKAAAAEKKVLPLAATGAGVAGLAALYGAAKTTQHAVRTGQYLAQKVQPYTMQRVRKAVGTQAWQPNLGLLGLAATSAAAYATNIPGSIKRQQQYELYAKHAKLLYSRLQDKVFQQEMGVTSWEAVRKVRKAAEAAGMSAQVAGSVVFAVLAAGLWKLGNSRGFKNKENVYKLSDRDADPVYAGRAWLNAGTVSAFALSAFAAVGAKPLIAQFMRKKGGADRLEAAFDQIVADAERAEREKEIASVTV